MRSPSGSAISGPERRARSGLLDPSPTRRSWRSSGRYTTGLRDISGKVVEAALAEFRRTGREAMLKKYRGGASTRWYIEKNDEHFDQKLVIRAAYAHEGLGRLEDFTAAHATRRLKQLGYRVVARGDRRRRSDRRSTPATATTPGERTAHRRLRDGPGEPS